MDNSNNPPKQLILPPIYHAVRQDLTEEEDKHLSARLAAATVSQEAWFVLDEMRVASIESLANIPYNPENPATYAALVMEDKARILVLSELLDRFKDKIR